MKDNGWILLELQSDYTKYALATVVNIIMIIRVYTKYEHTDGQRYKQSQAVKRPAFTVVMQVKIFIGKESMYLHHSQWLISVF